MFIMDKLGAASNEETAIMDKLAEIKEETNIMEKLGAIRQFRAE